MIKIKFSRSGQDIRPVQLESYKIYNREGQNKQGTTKDKLTRDNRYILQKKLSQ